MDIFLERKLFFKLINNKNQGSLTPPISSSHTAGGWKHPSSRTQASIVLDAVAVAPDTNTELLFVPQIGNFFTRLRLPVVTIYNAAFDFSSVTILIFKVGDVSSGRQHFVVFRNNEIWATESSMNEGW
jgi:hypothetical protein